MNQNPYAPPTARVADVGELARDEIVTPFFAVSPLKLVLMSIATLGIYQIYWFYRQWCAIRVLDNEPNWPAVRAILGVIFCFPCLKRISDAGEGLDVKPKLQAGLLTIGWIVTTLASRLDNLYALIAFGSVLFLLPVQIHVNRINTAVAPDHAPNARFSGWNRVALIVGVLLLILVVIGSFLPDE